MSTTPTFDWLEPLEAPRAASPETAPPPSRRELIWERAQPFLPWIGLLLVFLVLSLLREEPDTPLSPPASTVDVVAPLLPLPPKTPIRAEQLQSFAVRRAQLTKVQLMDIVRPTQMAHLKESFRTKKLVSPDRPLRWSDLEWATPGPSAGRAIIRYGTPRGTTP